MERLAGKVALVGVGGDTAVGKIPDRSAIQLLADAARMAMDDAGLTPADIDGFLTMAPRANPPFMYATQVAEYLNLYPLRYTTTLELGGATQCAMVHHAATAIAMGMAHTVLIALGENLLSAASRDKAVEGLAAVSGHQEFENPYGPLVPSFYALTAQRHMHEYGTTSEQLAQVAVAMRRHASLHPHAQMRQPITVEDVLSSRVISSPLHLLDCALISDGGGAVILTSIERAKDLRRLPILLLGAGEGHMHMYLTEAPSLTSTGAKLAGEGAFQMAGVERSDIDLALLYDCFTIIVLIELEDLGFCKPGEGGAFVEGGRIELGGELPLNTHGGLLSFAHPGRPGGIYHIIEAVRQLRGEAGSRHVPDAKLALVTGNGGYMSTSTALILGRT